MPRISDDYTRNSIYIYDSSDAAEQGRGFGASGFLVHVPFSGNSDKRQIYAVTNQHALPASPVIRFNKLDGGVGGFVTKQSDWKFDPLGDDIAVLHLNVNLSLYDFSAIGIEIFVTPKIVADEDIGIGDDTVMVGRFIGHDGKQRNKPAVRFGTIAMMQDKIRAVSGREQESFLIELHSVPGYSGSPVYIYSPYAVNDMSRFRAGRSLDPLSDFNLFGPNAQEGIELMDLKMRPKGPYLLGIDWCHLNSQAQLLDKSGAPHADGLFVRYNTGMAGVIPAWRIADLLTFAAAKPSY